MVLVLVLIVLALVFGVGSVLEGLAWARVITVALLAAAGWDGWSRRRASGTVDVLPGAWTNR